MYRPFARGKAKQLRRSSRNQLHKAVGAEASAGHAARVDQAHAVFDAGTAVGNFGEIVAAQFLLFLETKRTMVGRDNLEMILLEAIPKFFLMPLFPQRRSEDVLRSFKTGRIQDRKSTRL